MWLRQKTRTLSAIHLLKKNSQRVEERGREITFIIPFQLSPVDTLKSVRKAMPKLSKVAWRLRPSHGFSSEHSGERMKKSIRGRKCERGRKARGIGKKKRELCVD